MMVDDLGSVLDVRFGQWTTKKLGPRDRAHSERFALANPTPQLLAFRSSWLQRPDQEARAQVDHFGLKGNLRAAARRSVRRSRAHCETSNLRSRTEACSRWRAASFALPSSFSSLAAIRMARRNTSDFGTSHFRASASSARTDSTSRKHVNLTFAVAMQPAWSQIGDESISTA